VRESIPLFSIRQSCVQDILALDRLSLDDISPFSRKKLSQPSLPSLGTLTEDCPMDTAAAEQMVVTGTLGEDVTGTVLNERSVTSPTLPASGVRVGSSGAAPRSTLRAAASARTPAAITPAVANRSKFGGASTATNAALSSMRPLNLDPSSTPLSQQVRYPC
jgi:hypothetical protein